MSVPSMATAPLGITRRAASTVTTVPPVTTQRHLTRRALSGEHRAARIHERDEGGEPAHGIAF